MLNIFYILIEAKNYLVEIAKECKIDSYHRIGASLVLAPNLPFIRFQEYHIKIKGIGEKYMYIESKLGDFLTTILVNRKSLQKYLKLISLYD